jgi:UDP-N-acetylmuramyl-tripeptide synthetase
MDLYRIKSCWFDVAVFTNLTQDHLDFHGSMQAYWDSKRKLFTDYLNQGPKKDRAVAVINCNDNKGKELADQLTLPKLKIGIRLENDIKIKDYQCDLNGIRGRVLTPAGDFHFESAMAGEHNLENILCAIGVATALKIKPDIIKSGLEAMTAVPGRLERIENKSGRFVYVDYAHTPDALENVLTALRAISSNRIICIFGCGGDRDKAKRPLMGEIAGRLSDLAVITSDNPRTENPLDIVVQIEAGIERNGTLRYTVADLTSDFDKRGYVVEPDRRSAIELGIAVARPGDTVLIAGKGHETYQILGSKTINFDDREEARKALRAVSDQ